MTFCAPMAALLISLVSVFAPRVALAETGADAWLRYAPLDAASAEQYKSLPSTLIVCGDSPVLRTAQSELIRGLKGMLGKTLIVASGPPTADAILLGTPEKVGAVVPELFITGDLHPPGFSVFTARIVDRTFVVISGGDDRNVLYGVFTLLRKIALHQGLGDPNKASTIEASRPYTPLRWVNQWDNLDGTIERGYGGRSIFYEDGHVRADLTRVSEYARLLASVGINGCTVNNVNADPRILDPDFLPQLARIAEAFAPWGIQLGIAVDVSMPKKIGGLDTFDPLDPRVEQWWQHKFDDVYRAIPNLGGVVVKADSEGRAGPSSYGRTPADAANVIAGALHPHGGLLFYRAFVYDHHLDWTNPKNDRARAAYDIFHPLDGKFADNVIIQTKYGPIDFQVREPVSPLLGGLEHTNAAVELQVTQEYTGQQRHTCFLVPMWKEILDFDLRVGPHWTPVKEVVSGRSFTRPTGGIIGVVNVGLDQNWMNNHLALANLYGFARLAWDPNLSAAIIVDEWTRQTFGNDPGVVQTISKIQLASWKTYENYTGTLGLQTLTNITGAHYGPGPESQEHNGWGQWIRAEKDGVGMDRTVATGTGFVGQYSPHVQNIYESSANTPDDLFLFFHHVPYTYKLHSGKTVIQSIYDSHYDGADQAAQFVSDWKTLHGRIDDSRYADVLAQLAYQSGHAIVWRDAIDDWFHRISGIDDDAGRVGHHPDRTEAESMQLDGYTPVDVVPWEDASGGKAVTCDRESQPCEAKLRFTGKPGKYEVDVEYFDQNNGVSKFQLFIGNKIVDQWIADGSFPSAQPNGDTSVRRRVHGLALRPNDEIRIVGFPDRGERAPLDYVEIHAENPD